MRDWSDVLPPDVARAQHGYERRRSVVRMREFGMTYKAIGDRLGVGPTRVMQMLRKQNYWYGKGQRSPVEVYLDRGASEHREVAEWLKS